jgi:4-hydroxy-tetrahydrodipicolinate reductase
MTRAAIIGVSGRMGLALVRAAAESKDVSITAAVASPDSAALGKDAGELAAVGRLGVTVTSDLAAALAQADVAIDFSNASATQSNLAACRQARKPLLIGTTGFSPGAEFEAAAREIPLLIAPNTSLGVTILVELVRQAAAALPSSFDIEVIEAHHRKKQDAPSGTALALGQAAAEGRCQTLHGVGSQPEVVQGGVARHGDGSRQGNAPRQGSEIGFAVIRGGDIVGAHDVLFAGIGESLTLSHRATDRAIFARGALQAAAWLAPQPAGRYFMRDLVAYKSGS